MHLTPDILELTYDYLRHLPPFKGWRLPPGDTIEFFLTNHKVAAGVCDVWTDGRIRISISTELVAHTSTLLAIMAHEMVHVHVDRHKKERAHHGPVFKRYAARVCKQHGFDPKMF